MSQNPVIKDYVGLKTEQNQMKRPFITSESQNSSQNKKMKLIDEITNGSLNDHTYSKTISNSNENFTIDRIRNAILETNRKQCLYVQEFKEFVKQEMNFRLISNLAYDNNEFYEEWNPQQSQILILKIDRKPVNISGDQFQMNEWICAYYNVHSITIYDLKKKNLSR